MATSQEWRDADSDATVLKKIRTEIASWLVAEIFGRAATLDSWEKMHFSFAIASFRLNLNGLHHNTVWLRLVVVNIDNALLPENEREKSPPVHDAYNSVTFDDLLSEARAIQHDIAST